MRKMLLHRIMRKIGRSGVFYRIARPFCSFSVDISTASARESERRLSALHPDNGSSSICCNSIEEPYPYDLQIVVPAYNVEQYIVECIDSVLSQKTNYSFVVTVVNDGSTDRTPELLQRYAECQNVIVFNQENRGFSGARNAALEKILGKYITFLDSDDRLSSGAIEALMHRAEETQADIVEGGYCRFANDRTVSVYKHEAQVTTRWGVLYGFPVGKVFRSSMFAKVHFPQRYWFEDTVCIYMLYPQSNLVATIKEVVYEYRINENGITYSSKGDIRLLDALWVTRKMLYDAEKFGVSFDSQLYTMFLKDVCTNYTRFITLKNDTLHRDAFIVTCALMRLFFDGCYTQDTSLKPLEKALSEGDYGNYLLYGRCYMCE